MKKLLLLFGVAVLCTGCPGDVPPTMGTWCIENNTGKPLLVELPWALTTEYVTHSLPIEGETLLGVSPFGNDAKPNFNAWFNFVAKKFGNDASWKILSEDGNVVLKEWKYSERNLPSQRFFDGNSWAYDNDTIFWIFNLQPEDIVQ